MPKNDKKTDVPQLDLELGYSKSEFLFKIKRLASNIEKKFTALPFWRNGFIWAMIISTFSISTLMGVIIAKDYSKLPPDIPLLYNTFEEQWNLLPKIYIFAIPAIFFLLGFLNLQVLRHVYYMNKKMTIMICFTMTILNFLGLIATNEILLLSIS